MERALRPAAKATVLNSSAEANAVFHSCNFPSEKEYGGSRATDMTGFTVGDFPPPEAQVLATQSCGKSGNPAIIPGPNVRGGLFPMASRKSGAQSPLT
jgi:hypothetical protein